MSDPEVIESEPKDLLKYEHADRSRFSPVSFPFPHRSFANTARVDGIAFRTRLTCDTVQIDLSSSSSPDTRLRGLFFEQKGTNRTLTHGTVAVSSTSRDEVNGTTGDERRATTQVSSLTQGGGGW
ncbi:hypothetical protein Trydic_g20349 [Trypoxylus dichotomus]